MKTNLDFEFDYYDALIENQAFDLAKLACQNNGNESEILDYFSQAYINFVNKNLRNK